MKVEKVTLPLLATLFLGGNGVAIAGSASALDPYAYIQAPSRAEREQQLKKRTKKIKTRKLETAKEKTKEPVAAAPAKPVNVIIGEDSPQKPEKAKAPVKAASKDKDEDGFLAGIKQSSEGIAKSGKAVGSGLVNSTKSVGSSIAKGFKSAGEKVKDSTVAAAGKVKEGSSGVGGKVASGFKTAGGTLSSIPKAVGSAAGKVGNSTEEGAKKIAAATEGAKKLGAAPAAGLSALGHGIGKLNPFHRSDNSQSLAQKPEEKQTTAQPSLIKNIEVAEAKENSEADEQKSAESSPKAKAEKTAKAESEDKVSGVKKLISPATIVGLGASKVGLAKTKAGAMIVSQGVRKLNPFHRASKDEVKTPTAAASSVSGKKPEESSASENQTQIGERIQMNGEQSPAAESTAAGPAAVPQ